MRGRRPILPTERSLGNVPGVSAHSLSPSPTARPSPGQRTTNQARQRVLDAAAELFVRQGFASTSIRHIAAAAGLQAGSVYHHVESKDALLAEILDRGITVMDEAFDQAAVHALHADPHQRLRIHVRAHLGALFEHGPYTRAHVTAFFYAPADVQRAIVPVRDRYEQRWTDLLEELGLIGALRSDLDLGLCRLLLLGAMNSTVEWFDPERGNLDELTIVTAELAWNGATTAGSHTQ